MSTSVAEHKVERIVVAFDASQQSQALLRAAVQMAAQLEAELQGIFVEDANLLRLCSLPFSQDVGRFLHLPKLFPVDIYESLELLAISVVHQSRKNHL